MIDVLNEMLRQLFVTRIMPPLADRSQVSFELPDDEFRSNVKVQGHDVLNVCLVDLRENRTTTRDTRTPRRVDCHYLISAWSPASKSVEPALDEHALLYQAMATLMEAEPLTASRIYGAQPLPPTVPQLLRDAELPTVILPVERFPRIAEFWASTRGVHWKPTIHLIVTLPVVSNR